MLNLHFAHLYISPLPINPSNPSGRLVPVGVYIQNAGNWPNPLPSKPDGTVNQTGQTQIVQTVIKVLRCYNQFLWLFDDFPRRMWFSITFHAWKIILWKSMTFNDFYWIIQCCTYKDVQQRISCGYIKRSAERASPNWPQWRVYRVSNFMAAYRRGRSLTRHTTDLRLCVVRLVSLQSVSLKQMWPPPDAIQWNWVRATAVWPQETVDTRDVRNRFF